MARRPPSWLATRSTGDILIMLIAVTICSSVLATGGALAILAIVQPERDLVAAFNAVSDVINTLIGLLAGFLAGRTDAHLTIERGRLEAERIQSLQRDTEETLIQPTPGTVERP